MDREKMTDAVTEREKVLEVKDLTITFHTYAGQVQAVRGVSFDLHKGEVLAIVGESGSGKSVTNRALMGILAQTAVIENGTAMYMGRDLANPAESAEADGSEEGPKGIDLLKMREKEWEKVRGNDIAMIFQDPMSSLNPLSKVGKQISEVFRLKHKLSKAEAKAKTLDLMAQVGIPEPEKRYEQYPFHFSGGMRQRIVIAIALASSPSILICDEPTTALDVTIQAQVLGLIEEMQRAHDLSTIFITHDLGVVAHIADRVAVMYAGKIVEYGLAEEIFYDPRHPYTWSLMSSMPDMDVDEDEQLSVIQGTPPNMLHPPVGDAFAERNPYAIALDYEQEPPMFKISETHYAATWLMHPKAPRMELPPALVRRIETGIARRKEAANG